LSRRIRTATTANNGDKDDQQCCRSDPIDGGLDRELWAREYGGFHVEQGQAGHRTGEYPWLSDIGQSGHDHQVHFLAFQCPAEAPQPPGVKPLRRTTGHGDGADPLCDLGCL
jgi:hypothetical protein